MPFALTHESRPVTGRLGPIAGFGLRKRRGRWPERHLNPIFARLPVPARSFLGGNLRKRIVVLVDLPVGYASDVNYHERFHDQPEP